MIVQGRDSGRILIGWNPNSFSLNIIHVSSQMIHFFVSPIHATAGFDCSIVYAHNDRNDREALWNDFYNLSQKVDGPWVWMGDFNCPLNPDERVGALVRNGELMDFRACVQHCDMEDIKFAGNFYTWSNKQSGDARVFSKLDRVMANGDWRSYYHTAEVCFLNEGTFDHCPAVINVHKEAASGRKPFRYFHMWSMAPEFDCAVRKAWDVTIQGAPMYRITKKWKRLKVVFKDLNRKGFQDIQVQDEQARLHLMNRQEKLHANPSNESYASEEVEARMAYISVHKAYQSFLQQKAKLDWVREKLNGLVQQEKLELLVHMGMQIHRIRERSGWGWAGAQKVLE